MFWLGLIGVIGGTLLTAIGNVQKATAQAQADKVKADQLTELSKTGGYYDQQLAALTADLQDVEADRTAAGKMLAIQSAEFAQQGVQLGRQGAAATGSIAATAGAGNIGQGGSVAVRKGAVETQVQEGMASIARNVEQSRLQYEDQLRGLNTRQAQDLAQQTLTQFNKTTGSQEASQLTSEADWLNTWGVGLGVASAVLGGLVGLAGLKFPEAGPAAAATQPSAPATSSVGADTSSHSVPTWNPDPFASVSSGVNY